MMGGKSQQSTGTTTQSTTLPDNINANAGTNMAAAYNVAQNMLGPYTGPTYAGMTPGSYANIAGLQSLVGSTNPAFNLAQNTMGGLTGYAAPTINAPTLAGTNLSSYMNPYTQSVTNAGLQAIEAQRKQGLNTNADQAIAQKAFGGSRQGVQEGVTNAGAASAAGQLAATMGQQNFQNAQQAAQFDIQNNLGTQQANASNQMNVAGLNMQAANGLAGVAGQQQQLDIQSLMAALQGQMLGQQDAQGRLNADQAAYQAAQQFPLQQLQIPISALSATPYGSTTRSESTAPGSGAMQGIGAGLGILGSLGQMFSSSGGAAAGAAAAGGATGIGSTLSSMLPFLAMSDRNEKTDIKKIGKDPDSGIDMYAYRYKSDPKTYPKVVGPMAQDIEKKSPGSTRRIGGKLVIKRSML